MQLAIFYALRDWLHTNTDLKGDNIIHNQQTRGYGRQVFIKEKLTIFIYILSCEALNRDASKRFS
jgi:hypothetical protein